MKKLFLFIKKPPLYFSLLTYFVFFILAIFTLVALNFSIDAKIMNILYTPLGITFFYGVYLFVAYDYKKLKNKYKLLLNKLSLKSKFLNKYIHDLYYKTIVSSILSLFFNLFFVIYNVIATILYHSIWNGSISSYYFILLMIRFYILKVEFKMHKKELNEKEKNYKRIFVFKVEGIFLIFLDLAIIVPVTLIALLKKEISYPSWLAILDAAFTFYKVFMCIKGFMKSRKSNILTIRGLKNITLTEALISILNLEYAMILTFSSTQEIDSMHYLIISSSFIVILLNLIIAILTLLKTKKLKKQEM